MHIYNKQRGFGEATCYIYGKINGQDVLLTEQEFERVRDRARKQREDIPKPKRPWWKFWG